MLIQRAPIRQPIFRHYADAYLPQGELDGEYYGALGQVIADDRTHIGIPLDMRELNGREMELAHEQYAETTHIARCYGDPSRPLTPKHFLYINGCCYGIGYIRDEMQNGVDLELLIAKTAY